MADWNWGQAGKGAAGGAAAGSAFGPWGAAIGAGAGGLMGGLMGGGESYSPDRDSFNVPGYGSQYRHYGQLSSNYGSRRAPQARAFTAEDSGFRKDQRVLGNMLLAEAQGRGVGQQVVRMQAQDMADRSAQQQLAMAASSRPGAGAGAFQNAAFNAGNAQSAVGGQAALAGGQMQLGAMNQYGGFLQGARGQDQQLGMFNASQQQQGSQFNVDARLRQLGLNDQAQLEALRQRLSLSGMQQHGAMGYESLRAGQPVPPGFGDQLMGFGGGVASAKFSQMGSQGGGGGSNGQTWGYHGYGYY